MSGSICKQHILRKLRLSLRQTLLAGKTGNKLNQMKDLIKRHDSPASWFLLIRKETKSLPLKFAYSCIDIIIDDFDKSVQKDLFVLKLRV